MGNPGSAGLFAIPITLVSPVPFGNFLPQLPHVYSTVDDEELDLEELEDDEPPHIFPKIPTMTTRMMIAKQPWRFDTGFFSLILSTLFDDC